VLRLADELAALDADVMVAIGGGSNLDAAKAAGVLRSLGGTIDGYLGSGRVTAALHAGGRTLTPLVAVQTAASSAAHLTRYSNLTDLAAAQKKLIVDDAIVPPAAVFQYDVTHSTPAALAADGALDGHSHALEVLYGAVGQPNYEKIEQVALEAIRLVVHNLETVIHNLHDARARTALGLATDLGGYAIMLGGTNGGHLTSFSLTDVLSHGRACAILNPYYTVLFAAAIEDPLRAVGNIYRTAGLIPADSGRLHGRELALAVAEGMWELSRRVAVPTSLSEVRGLGPAHIARALAAAKDPQLKMKRRPQPGQRSYLEDGGDQRCLCGEGLRPAAPNSSVPWAPALTNCRPRHVSPPRCQRRPSAGRFAFSSHSRTSWRPSVSPLSARSTPGLIRPPTVSSPPPPSRAGPRPTWRGGSGSNWAYRSLSTLT
jgi:alcohol dehydrogenase class IV